MTKTMVNKAGYKEVTVVCRNDLWA